MAKNGALPGSAAYIEETGAGSPVSYQRLSRAELKTLFYVGRKLELTKCLMGDINPPSPRTVKAQKSYGYDMETGAGEISRLDFQTGTVIMGCSVGNGYTDVQIILAGGTLAAQYRLL